MSSKPDFNEGCESMRSHFGIYSIPEASALWCDVNSKDLSEVVSQMVPVSTSGVGRSMYTHPFIDCVEPISKAIASAMESGALPHGREDGTPLPAGDYAKYERRHTRGVDLKKWLINERINEKPAFLFDDLERNTHTSISADSYRVLLVDRDALKVRIENAKTEYRDLLTTNKELAKHASSSGAISETNKRSYELAIGLLTKALADKSGANCGTKEKPNYSGLSEMLQQYLPADRLGMPSTKSLSSESLRKKLPIAFHLLESN